MSMNQTEREVPAEIEEAIKNYGFKCNMSGWYSGEQHKIAALEAKDELLQAIITALEPERELRARCERLRSRLLSLAEGRPERPRAYVESAQGLHPGDLADDLTA